MGDPTDIVQLGTGHHVSVGEGQRRVALQRRVAAYLVVGGLEVGKCPFKITGMPEQPRNVASILDAARELGIRDAQALRCHVTSERWLGPHNPCRAPPVASPRTAWTRGCWPVRLEFPILSLHPGLRQRCVAPDVWPTLSCV